MCIIQNRGNKRDIRKENEMKKNMLAVLLLTTTILLFLNCKNNNPSSIYNPDVVNGATPIINEVSPTDSAYASVGQVIITGQNFSAVAAENLVFFDGARAEMIAASTTQLTVKPPLIVGDTLKIKVSVRGAQFFSEPFTYRLKPAVLVWGNLMDNANKGYAIAADLAGNVYVDIEGKIIKKISPDEKIPYTAQTSHYADVTFLKANGMKMGPDTTLYAAYGAGRVKKISTIATDQTEGTFASFSDVPQDLDFDAAGNVWATAGDDVYLIKMDGSSTKIKTFPVPVKTVRVFDGYLYISGKSDDTGEAKIWRCEILGETLGNEEVVLDIAATSWLAGITVNAFTFSADGEMYLGTDAIPDAIFVYDTITENYEPLFPGLIEANIFALCWDETNSLYAIQQEKTASNVLKLDMDVKLGAPYYGRK